MASPLPLFTLDIHRGNVEKIRLCEFFNGACGHKTHRHQESRKNAMFVGKTQCSIANVLKNFPMKCVGKAKAGLSVGYGKRVEDSEKAVSYLFRTEAGGLVKVSVSKKMLKYVVFIQVPSLLDWASDCDLVLNWSIFRSKFSMVPGFEIESIQSSTRTPFVKMAAGGFELELEFDSKEAPFYLSFFLCSSFSDDTGDMGIKTHRKTDFCVPVGIGAGHPAPLGASISEAASANFALFSKNAESVILCLYADEKDDESTIEIDLDPYINRTGNIWHVSLESVDLYTSYGYRCKGDTLWDKGHRFDMRHVLLDPYAKILGKFTADEGESVSLSKCLGRLCKVPEFDWSGDVRPSLPMEKLMVYRLNVGRFTADKSSKLSEGVAGSFDGVIRKMNHIKNLGMNAILLEPIFPFDEQNGPYLPSHFFSPTSLYGPARDSVSAINSLKEMVKTLHANGMEILLEVVFNQTAEGGDSSCQVISFRGIDNASYYHIDGDAGQGAGSALNCNNPIVQRLILDSLRHWVTEFHIDGFCFVSASSLTRGPDGEYTSRPPLVEAITFDPILSKSKIIADCLDQFNLSYKGPPFPHWKRWAEMNSGFCFDIRNFLRGEGLLSDLATRLCGSGDVFSGGRGPAFSFNFFARNSGLSLVDLVSFSSEELSSELSWNCGEEGPTNRPDVLETRLKQIRNFIFVLYTSLGVPVMNMGDECGQSTSGVPSSNSRKPFDWTTLRSNFAVQTTQFIAYMGKLRTRRSEMLQKKTFWKVENIDWCGSDLSTPIWDDPECRFLAMTLKSEDAEMGDLFIAFNSGNSSESIMLPELAKGKSWVRMVDTAFAYPGFFSLDGEPLVQKTVEMMTYEMKSHSCALFEVRSSSAEVLNSSTT